MIEPQLSTSKPQSGVASSRQVRRRRLPASQRHALIIEAAARVFAECGYAAASMREIASTAGVVKSVVYDHFRTKRELHIALLEHHAQGLIEHVLGQVRTDSPEAFLRTNTEAFFEWVERHPYGWRMLFRDPPADPEIEAVHREIHRRGLEAIAGLVALAPRLDLNLRIPRAQANELAAQAVKSIHDGLAGWWYDHPELPRRAVVGMATELAWRGLGGILAAETADSTRSQQP